jgi:hypothetical protein
MRYVRYALLLLAIALVGPSAAGALADNGARSMPSFRSVGAAPAEINVAGIQFSLQKGDNATPIAPDTRFRYGTRKVWAFWTWDNAKKGASVRYVLRFGQSDVAWGEIPTDDKSGRMEIDLERLDGFPFDIGGYRLYLDAVGGDSSDLRSASFEIYDDDIGNDNGNSNNNNSNNNNGNNNSNNSNNNNSNNSNDNGNSNINEGSDNDDGD